MALLPSRTKYRKVHKGRIYGTAQTCNKLAFGEFGIQSLTRGRMTSQQIFAMAFAWLVPDLSTKRMCTGSCSLATTPNNSLNSDMDCLNFSGGIVMRDKITCPGCFLLLP